MTSLMLTTFSLPAGPFTTLPGTGIVTCPAPCGCFTASTTVTPSGCPWPSASGGACFVPACLKIETTTHPGVNPNCPTTATITATAPCPTVCPTGCAGTSTLTVTATTSTCAPCATGSDAPPSGSVFPTTTLTLPNPAQTSTSGLLGSLSSTATSAPLPGSNFTTTSRTPVPTQSVNAAGAQTGVSGVVVMLMATVLRWLL